MAVFSGDLIAKIKERYSDNSDGLHEALHDPNPANALFWLNEYASVELTPQYVVEMLESGRADDLLASARDICLRIDLCREATEQASKQGASSVEEPIPGSG